MLRRFGSKVVRNSGLVTKTHINNAFTLNEQRRCLEPMSTWYLASWSFIWTYSFLFMFPAIWVDVFSPSFTYGKLPTMHFIQEKHAERKLRQVLDATYTEWSNELDQTHITNAIARTFENEEDELIQKANKILPLFR